MSDPQQNRQPLRDSTESSPSNGAKTDYHVGYKRPPFHTRFKPGQSGNPKGRPAGRRNHKTTIERVMNETVSVREGEKTRHMTKFEAMLQAQTVKGMKGDARSTGVVINMMSRTGLLGDQESQGVVEGSERGGPAGKLRPADALFENVDPNLLSNDEMIELSRLAEIIDRSDGDVTALNIGDFERLKHIVNKGRGKDLASAV